MNSKYYITNHLAVNFNLRVQLARTQKDRNDDNTFLMAAPIIEGLPQAGIAVYLSTNGDPVLIGTWSNNENIWSIWDEQSAEDSSEDYPNDAGYLRDSYGINSPSDIDSLMVEKNLFA